MAKINWKTAVIGMVIVVIAVVVGAVLLLSSGDDDDKTTGSETTLTTLTVSGSGGTVAVLQGIQARFAADTPGYQLDILPGSGTSAGVAGVIEGVLDIVAMARQPKEDEAIEYLDLGESGQAFIAHADVGISGLTGAQALDIVSGTITNWSEIGGPDLPIIVYVRDEGDSTTQALRAGVLGDDPFSTNAQVLTSQSDMITAVENTAGSIGMCTWPAVVAMGADVTMLTLDGVAPDDPAYPIINVMGIGYSAENQAHIQPLLDWLTSEAGQNALRDMDVLITP